MVWIEDLVVYNGVRQEDKKQMVPKCFSDDDGDC